MFSKKKYDQIVERRGATPLALNVSCVAMATVSDLQLVEHLSHKINQGTVDSGLLLQACCRQEQEQEGSCS